MIAAIIIGSVVAYLAVAGVTYGALEETSKGRYRDPPNEIRAVFWPITVVTMALIRLIPPLLRFPVRLGRRLAAPRPALPEARVIKEPQP